MASLAQMPAWIASPAVTVQRSYDWKVSHLGHVFD